MSDLKRLQSLGYLAPLSNYHSNESFVHKGSQKPAQYYPDLPCMFWNHGLLGVAGINQRGKPKKFWPRNPNGTAFNNKKLEPVKIPVLGLTPPGFPERINIVEYVFAVSRYKQDVCGWQAHHRNNFWVASWDDPFGNKHKVKLGSIGKHDTYNLEMTCREYIHKSAVIERP